MPSEQRDDFDDRNSSLVNSWPDWKRQYNIRVEPYSGDPADEHPKKEVTEDRDVTDDDLSG